MGLIQQPLLGVGGLGSQVHVQKMSGAVQLSGGVLKKAQIGGAVLGLYELEVDVKPLIALLVHDGKNIQKHPVLKCPVVKELAGPLGVEVAVLGYGGEKHHRDRPILPGQCYQGLVVWREQPALGGEAVDGKVCKVRQSPAQYVRAYIVIGVAVDSDTAALAGCEVYDHLLPHVKGGQEGQLGVVLQQNLDRHAVSAGYGREGVPLPYRVGDRRGQQ